MSTGGAQLIILGPFPKNTGAIHTSIKIYHYAAGTTTTKTVWSDEARTTTAEQPVVSNSFGIVSFYADGDYKFVITDGDGNSIITYDNYKVTSDMATMWEGNEGTAYPSANATNRWQLFAKHTAGNVLQEIGINDGTAFRSVSSSALPSFTKAGLPTAGTAGRIARVTDNIRGIWRDTGTAWVSITGWADVKDFGAIGDDSTDDTSSIQAAINAIESSGGIVFFPIGTYKVTSAITLKANLELRGSQAGLSKIRQTTSYVPTLRFNNSANPITNQLTIHYLVIATSDGSTSHGIWISKVAQVWIDHVSINSSNQTSSGTIGGDGIRIDTSCQNIMITNSTFGSANKQGIYIDLSQDILIEGNLITENLGKGISVNRSTGVMINGNLVTNNNGIGIEVLDGKSFGSTDPFVSIIGNSVFDSGNAIKDLAIAANAGIDYRNTKGAITGNTSYFNGGEGINLRNVSDVVVSGNVIANNGKAANAFSDDGIQITAGGGETVSDVIISGNRVYDDQGTKTQDYGIRTNNSGTMTRLLISENQLTGNKTGSYVEGSVTSTKVIDNIGYNPVGISTITPDVSPYTYTAGTSPETIYIYGGTVSNISVGGSAIASASPAQVSLPPNVALVITYTVAPTMRKYIH